MDFRKISLTLIFVLILVVGVTREALAEGDLTPKVAVNHLANPTEKIFEKINIHFKFKKADRASYLLYLLDKRLGELYFVVNNNKVNDIEPVASRYDTYTQATVNFLMSNDLNSKKDSMIEELLFHRKIIENLQKNFEYDSGWWLAIQHDLNTIDTSLVTLQESK